MEQVSINKVNASFFECTAEENTDTRLLLAQINKKSNLEQHELFYSQII